MKHVIGRFIDITVDCEIKEHLWSAISQEGSQIFHPLLPMHGADSTSLA